MRGAARLRVELAYAYPQLAAGLVLAPWGVLPWAIGVLTATAWFTVVQRILHVRRELRIRVG